MNLDIELEIMRADFESIRRGLLVFQAFILLKSLSMQITDENGLIVQQTPQ